MVLHSALELGFMRTVIFKALCAFKLDFYWCYLNQQTQDQDGSWPNHKIGHISAYNPNIVKISSLYFEIDGPPPLIRGSGLKRGMLHYFTTIGLIGLL